MWQSLIRMSWGEGGVDVMGPGLVENTEIMFYLVIALL